MARRLRRILYGWRGPGGTGYCLSKIPPDVPLLPLDCHSTIDDAEKSADDRKAIVIWCGSALLEKQRQHHGRDPADVWRL